MRNLTYMSASRASKLIFSALLATCMAFASLAVQVHRQALNGKPLSTVPQKSLIEKQMLPSRKADPKYGISEVLPLPVHTPLRAGEATVPEVDIYVSLLEDNKNTTTGLYKISSKGGEFTRVTYGPFAQNGGVYQDGYYFYSFADTYWGMQVYYSFLYDGNQATWPQVKGGEQDNAKLCACAIANNPVTNQAYGCFYTPSGSGYELGVLDIQNFTRTTVCSLPTGWSACGFTADGTLYALLENGQLATINLENGTATAIGATGLPIDGPTSGTIDYRTGTFYYATNAPGNHALYVIDLANAQPTKLFDLPNEACLGGMFIKYPKVIPGTPGPVTELTVNFAGESLQGTVDFTTPSKTADGLELNGTLTYEVSVNGQTVASGNCNAATLTSAPVTVNAPGSYSFEVIVKNGSGSSDPVKQTLWVGHDNPAAPQSVTMTLDRDLASLTWEPVGDSEHGGYINPQNITYGIIRQPQGVKVASGLTDCRFSETLTDQGDVLAIYYEVTAHDGQYASEATPSNAINHGTIMPPYLQTFDNANVMNTFTIIDANHDGATWSFNYDKVQVKFHAKNQMDDWLVTSPVTLEQGKCYDLTLDVRAHNPAYTPERFEVMMGNAPTPQALTTELIPPTDVTAKEYNRYTGRIKVSESGKYYIGIHGISPADKYYMYVDNLSIGAAYQGDTPGVATDFAVTPDYDGRTRGTVCFRAPSVSTNGTQLDEEMTVTVSRNDQVVHTFGGISPGQECTFVDTASEIGEYRYTVVASNSFGKGAVMAANGRLGVNLAAAPLNPTIVESGEGNVKLHWESPAKDINGYPLNPDAIRYAILDRTGQTVLAENLSGTDFSLQVLEPGSGRQAFVFYYILPQTAAGVNFEDYVYTEQIPVGTPYAYPFEESFAGGKASNAWAITRLSGTSGSWGIGPASQQPVANPQDEDGGLAAFMPTQIGDEALFHSGKIQIPASADDPCLSFWYFGVTSLSDKLDVMICEGEGNLFRTIASFTLGQYGDGWHRVVLPLSEYKGKTIRIGFWGECTSYSALTVIDNIKVTEVLDGNMALTSLSAPARVTAGTPAYFTVSVENRGLSAAQDVKVSLIRDGQTVATKNIPYLNEDSRQSLAFTDTPGIFSADRVVYVAKVEHDADTRPDDNESLPIDIKVSAPALPRVTDLEAAGDGCSTVRLTWTSPSQGQEPDEMLESFENAEAFLIDTLEGWTFVDADGKTTFGIEGGNFPNNGKPMAYMVINQESPAFGGEFNALSGKQCLASFNADDGSVNDNWAISPLLNGKPQTVKFSARAQTNAYGYEAFEFLYSTTDTDPASFIKVADDKRVSSQWKEYSFDVPQGAKYFAIRCISEDAFVFMVDDILFTPAAMACEQEPIGYHLYSDMNCQTTGTPLSLTRHTHNPADDAWHTYHVTALYPQGESLHSNPVRMSTTALNAIQNGTPVFFVQSGYLWGANLRSSALYVTDMSGKVILTAVSVHDGPICPLQPGIYLVKTGQDTFKVVAP